MARGSGRFARHDDALADPAVVRRDEADAALEREAARDLARALSVISIRVVETIPGTITLPWQTSIRATSYRVEIATEPEFVSSQLVIPGVTGTSVPIPPGTLQGGQVHYWRVTAVNTFGERMSATAPRWFVPQIPGCAGDSDRNGKVDFNDITSVLVHWGTGGPVGDADFNQSVNTRDLTIVLLNLGNPCGAI